MSAEQYTRDTIARAEQLVSRVQGISSCRIEADETGRILEVHVVATTRKSPKLVSRDVETLLRAELGIHVDYKKIGVVVMSGDPIEDPPVIDAPREADDADVVPFEVEEYPSRFAFRSVNLFLSQDSVAAEVELVRDRIETLGRASSDNPGASPARIVAEATLKAVADIVEDDVRFCLADLVEIPFDDGEAVAVRVNLVRSRDTKSLAGCALLSGNASQTVVFATLDAVNRVVGKLKTKSTVEYRLR